MEYFTIISDVDGPRLEVTIKNENTGDIHHMYYSEAEELLRILKRQKFYSTTSISGFIKDSNLLDAKKATEEFSQKLEEGYFSSMREEAHKLAVMYGESDK